MVNFFKDVLEREGFRPTPILGLIVNPFFLIRRGLAKGVSDISKFLVGGALLDVGCGRKPYRSFFNVDQYVGIDVDLGAHSHKNSEVDIFYDGKTIPFEDGYFDHCFSSEVFEHIFDIDSMFEEISRVLKARGYFGFTCPFVWDEHEVPFDFGRYTSFGIVYLLEKHGFEVIYQSKSTNYVETIIQMLSAYVWQHLFPKNQWVRLLLQPIFVAPINLVGLVLGSLLPKNYNFYHNNLVVARKLL